MTLPTQKYSAAELVSSIGINIHTGFWDTGYGFADRSGPDILKIERALTYLGINSVRDGILYSFETPALAQLGRDGFKLDLVYYVGNDALTVQEQVAAWASLAPYLNSVEGPNESDNWQVSYGGQTGLAATRLVQAELYRLVHSTAALNGVPVIETSLGSSSSYAALANLGQADYGNTHSYFFDFTQPIFTQIPSRIAEEATVAPGLPTIATEAGYESSSQTQDWFNVDQSTQAKLTLDLVLDQFKAGVSHTYIYELLDVSIVNDYFGLFDDNGRPKLAATALHNMTDILHDPGGTATGTNVTYSLSFEWATLQSMLLYKSNGMVDIALWNEAPVWNSNTHTAIPVAPISETISFGGVQALVWLYDPLVQSAPLQSWTNVDSISITVPDHPIFIEIDPEVITPRLTLTPTTVAQQSATPGTTLYRFFDMRDGTHFFTSDATEAAGLRTPGSATYRADLMLEKNTFGTLSTDAATSDPNAMSINRLFDTSNGMHFFTASASEIADLTTPGSTRYRPDLTTEPGSAFYAHRVAEAGDVAVYRFFDTGNGSHFFSGSAAEAQAISTAGSAAHRADLVAEGIAFYAPAAS